MRLMSLALIACTLALPVRAEILENEMMKVFEGKWVQSKDPSQNGILMYLTQERSAAGEYFSIRCEGSAQSVRIAYPKRRSAEDVGVTIDGKDMRVPVTFTGKTQDPNFLKGNVFGYEMTFEDAAAQKAFLTALRNGRMLKVEGQSLPVELAGSGQAIREQAAYCR
ncbi:hypothetical protein [Pseudooceanicola sp. MF1-13]|uniref:hypothetical protein n=1 Tax=Pseudooceanicola sp. MF1-13 TaxID=3379095 RepID=UPI0038928BF3